MTAFTKQERRGILTFVILAISIIWSVKWYESSYEMDDEDMSQYYWPLDSLDDADGIDDNLFPDIYSKGSYSKKHQKRHRFEFDPNTISQDSIVLLGFSSFSAKNLVNFRNKGGKIRNVDKLKSIYGIDSILVNELASLMNFESVNAKTFKTDKRDSLVSKFNEVEIIPQDLNAIDSLQLIALKGIGPYFAYKILDYRRQLGGYLSKTQLLEISKINDSIYTNIEKYFFVDATRIERMDINTMDYKRLVSHPYFTHEITSKILKYRKQHGPFEKASDISRIKNLKESEGQKILPYLSPQ